MKKYTFIFIWAIFFVACKDKENAAPCSGGDLQVEMLANVADNIIVPGYARLKEKVDSLQNRIYQLPDNPQLSGNLWQRLKSFHTEVTGSYLEVAQHEFGPATDVSLRSKLNNFPLDTAAMFTKLRNRDYDFSALDSYDKGIPALGWLIYRHDASSVYSTNKIDYLIALIDHIKENVDQVNEAWGSGYRNTFVNNTGNAAGTSLSLLVNALNENYEITKRDRVGIPAGVLTLGFPNPEKVEALYNYDSKNLVLNSLFNAKSLYKGIGKGGVDGIGLDDILQSLDGTGDGVALDAAIQSQFDKALTAFNALDESLFLEITTNPEVVQAAYVELVENVVHLKTDMPSVLCVSITYVDNPSDSD